MYKHVYTCIHVHVHVYIMHQVYDHSGISGVGCGTLSAPEHGQVSQTGAETGSQGNYSCEQGFTLSEDETRVCLDNGEWSGTQPTCNGTILSPVYFHRTLSYMYIHNTQSCLFFYAHKYFHRTLSVSLSTIHCIYMYIHTFI